MMLFPLDDRIYKNDLKRFTSHSNEETNLQQNETKQFTMVVVQEKRIYYFALIENMAIKRKCLFRNV